MTVVKSRQKGLSTLGWLVAILVGGFTIMLTFKMAPVYLDDYAISKLLISLGSKPGIEEAGVPQVEEWLNKGLLMNRIKLARGEWQVLQDKGQPVVVEMTYERRVHLIYNIDLVLTFEHNWNAKPQ